MNSYITIVANITFFLFQLLCPPTCLSSTVQIWWSKFCKKNLLGESMFWMSWIPWTCQSKFSFNPMVWYVVYRAYLPSVFLHRIYPCFAPWTSLLSHYCQESDITWIGQCEAESCQGNKGWVGGGVLLLCLRFERKFVKQILHKLAPILGWQWQERKESCLWN